MLITARSTVKDSKIIDPILGVERRMMDSWRGRTNLAFRHDFPNFNLNYGMNVQDSFDGGRLRYDIDDTVNASFAFILMMSNNLYHW